MKLLSDLYNVTLKRGIEGAAKGGFVRPTIGENFMSHRDFIEIPSFTPPTIGEFVEGGYYFGTIDVGGTTYYLVAAPTASGEGSSLQWGDYGTLVAGADSLVDGYQNTIDLEAGTKPAADFCRNLTIGGYSDWYLPAKDELDLLYTNHAALESAGAGTFKSSNYWSSTEANSNYAWHQDFANGDRHSNKPKYRLYYVRAIRRFAA